RGQLHPDLAGVPLEGRTVRVVPDADYRTNENVRAAVDGLTRALDARGAKSLELVHVPDGFKGIDDWLVGNPTGAAWATNAPAWRGSRPRSSWCHRSTARTPSRQSSRASTRMSSVTWTTGANGSSGAARTGVLIARSSSTTWRARWCATSGAGCGT